MAKQIYWLSDEELARLEPLLPQGRRGGAHLGQQPAQVVGVVSPVSQQPGIGPAALTRAAAMVMTLPALSSSTRGRPRSSVRP